jgi:uncharacterized protein with NRDE domain
MCTVSIVPTAGGFRLVSNRDESRSRAIASPPRIVLTDGVRAVMPIDPDSGGTWVAGSEHGLAFAILNLNLDPSPSGSKNAQSRGEIIPDLLAARTVEEASEMLLGRSLESYRPYRLILAAAGIVCELRQSPPISTCQPLTAPVMFTSSGLGDHLVEAPRRALFDRMMAGGAADVGDLIERQDRFHAHQWPSERHISVMMERLEASTVSRTVLLVEGECVHMEYTAVGQQGRNVSITKLYRAQSSK